MTEHSSEFQMVPLEQLHESRFNPRRHFDDAKMAELVESVKRLGVLTPLLARPNASGYEIAAGHRRYRAAKKAGVESVPVRIRPMTDAEFLEVVTIENLQREDIHPLDEALGYQALMEKAGYDVDAIAAKVSKSASYVYQRLKLVELIEPAKKAFLEDRITAGHAILIARLQPKDQKEALENSFGERWNEGTGGRIRVTISVRELSAWIDGNVHLDLKSAPFKKDDAELVAAAGACTTCPKRTGFVPALFPDIAKKDTCTDRSCFNQKLQAHIGSRKQEASAAGEKLVEISKEYGYGKPESGKPLTSNQYTAITGKTKKCDSAEKAIVVGGHEDRGQVLSICRDMNCKVHHPGSRRYQDTPEGIRQRAEEKRRQEKATRETKRRRRILDAIVAAVPGELGPAELELVALGYLHEMQQDDKSEVWKAHGWEQKKDRYSTDWDKSAAEAIAQVGAGGLARFLIELALARHVKVHYYAYAGTDDRSGEKPLLEAARRYKVDVKAIEKQLAGELAEKKKAKAARAKKAAAKETKAATPKKPKLRAGEHACEVCGCTESRACDDGFGDGCSWRNEFLRKKRYVCSSCEPPAKAVTTTTKPKPSAAARKAQAARMNEYWAKRKAASAEARA